MRAMVIDRFGEPEVLRMAQIPAPACKPGEVLIALEWAGVNPADWKARQGWLSRYFDYRFPFVVGFDGAGTVIAVGDGVSEFVCGDRVMTCSNQGLGENGTYAEVVCSAADRVARIADHVPFAKAAAVPTAAITAMEALFDVGGLQPGQRVLVNGGAGGTGSYAIRLAVAAGARVAATASAGNHAYLRSLGAECPIDYRHGQIGEAVCAWADEGPDLVVDTVGQGTLLGAVDWVRPGGIIAPIGTLVPNEPTHDAARAAARGVRVVPTIANFARQGRQLRALATHLDEGLFEPVEIAAIPLSQAVEAHRRIEAGHVRGKIVLEIAQ